MPMVTDLLREPAVSVLDARRGQRRGRWQSDAGTGAQAQVVLHASGGRAAHRLQPGKDPNIRRHYLLAVSRGWPRVMVINRKGADARRDRLLEDIPTRAGFDRDEYPAAVGRGRPNGDQRGLVRGINPIGWMADVAYVPSSENRSHGSSLGAKLRPFCDGTKFQYAFN